MISLDDLGAVADELQVCTIRGAREHWRPTGFGPLIGNHVVRIRPSTYVMRTTWDSWFPSQRHIAQVLAAVPLMGAFSHVSAAALHGLPLYPFRGDRAHVTREKWSSNSSKLVMRHRAPLSDESLDLAHGLAVTRLERTLVDLARSAPGPLAAACLDVGYRRLFEQGLSREEVHSRLDGLLSSLALPQHLQRARLRIELANGLADSPLESVAYFMLVNLGFRVAQQVPIRGANGSQYFIDLELLDFGILIEIDGLAKYHDLSMRNGQSAEEVVVREKLREDDIRAVTQKRVIRLTARELSTMQSLRSHLARLGIRPPLRRPSTARSVA